MEARQPSHPGHGASRTGMRRESANIRAPGVVETRETQCCRQNDTNPSSS